jgi:hypothetical protein
MTLLNRSLAEHELTQLVAQFEHWRHCRPTRAEPIPPALWEQAVALTAVLPRSRVAKALRVSWRDLHKHCAASHAASGGETSRPPQGFVEVPAVSAGPLATPETAIELHRADGAWLRIHSREPQVSLTTLMRTFLETS